MHDHATERACWKPGDVVHFADGSVMVIGESAEYEPGANVDEWLDQYRDDLAPAAGAALARAVLVVGCVGAFAAGVLCGWWL